MCVSVPNRECVTLTCLLPGIISSSCKEFNKVRSKVGALIILRDILGKPIDINDLPDFVRNDTDAHQSIVEAPSVGRVQGVKVEPDGVDMTYEH